MTKLLDFSKIDEGSMFLLKFPKHDIILGIIENDRYMDSARAKMAFNALNQLIIAAFHWHETDGSTLAHTTTTGDLTIAIAQLRTILKTY